MEEWICDKQSIHINTVFFFSLVIPHVEMGKLQVSYSGIKLPIHTVGSMPTLAIRAIPCGWFQAGGVEHITPISHLSNHA